MLRREDIEGPPCECTDCRMAGVTHLPIRRDPHTGGWIHGAALGRWHAARERFLKGGDRRKPKTWEVGDTPVPPGDVMFGPWQREPGEDDE